MRFCLRLFCAAAVAALCEPALATWQEKKGVDTTARLDEVDLVFGRIAGCIVESHPRVVERWLSLVPGSDAETNYVRSQEGLLNVCMKDGDNSVVTKGRLSYVANRLRSYVVAGAVGSLAGNAPAQAPAVIGSEPWYRKPLRKMDVLARRDQIALIQQEFGHCVLLRDWVASVELVRSKPGSNEERSAIRKLGPALGACVQQGTTVQLTAAAVRNALNEPFYHAVRDASREAVQ